MSDKTTKQIDDQMRVNRSIWKDTMQKSEFYNTDKSKKYTEHIRDEDISITKVEPLIKVFHEDIYNVFNTLHTEGFRSPPPLYINPGNNNFPIPGVNKGAIGIEMDLLRRSNYYSALEEVQYPIMEGQSIYSPTVVVFKGEDHKRIENPVSLSILNIPPLHGPRLISMPNPSGKGYIEVFDSANDENRARQRIYDMFRVAILRGHNTIVIPNYGEGNNNPTEKLIEIFNDAIKKYPISYIFFAIKTHKQREKDKDFHLYHKLINRNV
jgi:hypothetical protein